MYLREIIWLLTWPATILLSMWIANVVLKKYYKFEKLEENED
jgi:hypothetical protein